MFRLTYLISLVVQNYGFINRICIAVSKSTPKSCSTVERGPSEGAWKLGEICAERRVEKSLRQIRKGTDHKRYPCLSISNQSLKPFLKWNFEKIREFPKSRRHFGEGLKHFEIFWRVCSTHFTLYETTNKVFVRRYGNQSLGEPEIKIGPFGLDFGHLRWWKLFQSRKLRLFEVDFSGVERDSSKYFKIFQWLNSFLNLKFLKKRQIYTFNHFWFGTRFSLIQNKLF